MKRILLYAPAAFSALLLSSCNKEIEENVAGLTAEQKEMAATLESLKGTDAELDALSGNEVTRTHEYTIKDGVITLNTAATDSANSTSYTITELDNKEMSWQKVGTTYTPGSNGSDYKHFKRK